jgi:thioredoxin-like negative regulator of GroEL
MGYRLYGIFLVILGATAQTPDPYAALRAKDYASAIRSFEQMLALSPLRADIHKDLAYTLLRVGETEAARGHFAEAMRLDKTDDQAALEYAFLCYETKQAAEARRVFDRLRREARAEGNRDTAAAAFENIDGPLREGIARWLEALSGAPGNFSAHEELAHLAELRDDFALASVHIEKAWRMRPARRDLLLDLGRTWASAGRAEEAHAAILAASRSGESPRSAEQAHALLPARYPYVYEFEKALALEPGNLELRRELAYLHLQMGDSTAAEVQFATLVQNAPEDLLATAQLGFLRVNRGDQGGALLLDTVLTKDHGELAGRIREVLHLPKTVQVRPVEFPQRPPNDTKFLADRSLEKGYLSDALMYLHAAHETDPSDFNVTLKLGRTYNILRDDHEAVRWFGLARQSPQPEVAYEAAQAYRNLAPGLRRFRTTVWAAPMYSSRWHDTFAYAQIKTEWVPRGWFVRPYVSARFIGDTRGAVMTAAGLGPQYLSERSAIVGLGVAAPVWRGLSGWFEAGASLRGSDAVPDYRGGAAFARGIGAVLVRGSHGWFAETNNDAVFVSRFGNDTLLYTQNRAGYTWRGAEGAAGFHAQMYWNTNITGDVQKQPWANFAESGPGLRFAFEGLPAALMFTVNAVHGAYLVPQYGARRATFNDLRIGIWYAVTH